MARSMRVKGLLSQVITYREECTTMTELDNAGLENLSSDPQEWGRYRCAVAEMSRRQQAKAKTPSELNSHLVYVSKTYKEGGR